MDEEEKIRIENAEISKTIIKLFKKHKNNNEKTTDE